MSANDSGHPVTVEELTKENESLRNQLEKALSEIERLRKELEEALRAAKRRHSDGNGKRRIRSHPDARRARTMDNEQVGQFRTG